MNLRTSRMILPVRRRQIFGVVAILVAFILVELVVVGHDKLLTVSSNEAHTTTR